MKFILLLFLVVLPTIGFSQNLKDTVTECVSTITLTDTIHVSGIVRYGSGKPAKGVRVSTNLWSFGVYTFTDSTGRFYLENVRLKDTLEIRSTNSTKLITNNGTRTLNISIPPVNESPYPNTTIRIAANSDLKKEALNIKLTDNCACCFYSLEVAPEYPGGYKKLHDFIKSHLKYPAKAINENLEGEVVVQFTIGEYGKPKNFTILSGLSQECDDAAIMALKKMPDWRPGIFFGRRAEYPQSIAVQFAINRNN